MSDREGIDRLSGEHRMTCRHGRAAGRWTRKEEGPSYAPDRTCDVEHIRLECAFDLENHAVDAVCTQTLRAAYGPFDRIGLDAHDLAIVSVRDGAGRELPYTYLDLRLQVRFPEPVAERIDLVIAYRVKDPVDGLFFLGPDKSEPEAHRQCWSQNEDEGARHWIPCHDAPNERFTIEQIVTASAEYAVIANGRLVSCETLDGRRRWHYREEVAIPSYLVSVVVGIFSKLEDTWNGIPVEYWVEPGREEEGRRSFGRTPDMLEFFSKQLDFPYPYEKYAQVAVRHFHFGGMENASATTQTDGTLHDERAALDFTSDDLVSHELAHQWFGDLITCKSWEHAWLNEGFATYLEALWKEWDLGREEFDYEMVLNADSYMAEDYRRPIATPKYGRPFQLFDMHLYPKAGWVLHMLRRQLGEELFWKAIRLYVRRHAHGTAETIDLVRCFEDASGRNLTGFFSQWIFSPGHPQLEGEVSWEEEKGWVHLALKQTQGRQDGTPLFRLPLHLEARLSDGSVQGATFEMTKAEQSFYLPLPSKPLWVALDPEGAVLRETRLKMPFEWTEAALAGTAREERVHARVDRVRDLAQREAGTRATALLGRVLLEDPFWGVQAEAATALARFRTPAALQALVSAVGVEHPKARRAVVAALGRFREARASVTLLKIVREGDPSYQVQAAALTALGESGGAAVALELREHLAEAMERRDWHDAIALGAIQGLAAARDEGCFDALLAAARDRSRYWNLRVTAARALGAIGAARPQHAGLLAEELAPLLDDPRILVANRTPSALVALGHPAGLAPLRRRGETAPRPEDREACLEAADDLSAKLQKGEEVDRLRTEAEKLREELRELRETVEMLKARVLPEGDGAPPAKAAPKSKAPSGAKGSSKAAAAPKGKAASKTRAPSKRATVSKGRVASKAKPVPRGKARPAASSTGQGSVSRKAGSTARRGGVSRKVSPTARRGSARRSTGS